MAAYAGGALCYYAQGAQVCCRSCSISPSRSLPSEWLDNLCPEPFQIRQTGREVVWQVVELAGDMRQPHLIAAALQALATILVVARNRPFCGISTEGEPERHGACFLHRPFMVATEGQ